MSRDETNVREAARLLGVHENTIRNWVKAGILAPSRRLPSGPLRFDPAVIQRMRDEMWKGAPATEMPKGETT